MASLSPLKAREHPSQRGVEHAVRTGLKLLNLSDPLRIGRSSHPARPRRLHVKRAVRLLPHPAAELIEPVRIALDDALSFAVIGDPGTVAAGQTAPVLKELFAGMAAKRADEVEAYPRNLPTGALVESHGVRVPHHKAGHCLGIGRDHAPAAQVANINMRRGFSDPASYG